MAKKMGGLAKAARRKHRKRAGGSETRRKKEFTYRGYTLEELKALTTEDLLSLLPSRVRRSYIRGLDEEHETFVTKLREAESDDVLKTHCRDLAILPDFVGKTVMIHSGKAWQRLTIRAEMIGHYLGEFALTRREVKHSGPGVGATRSSKFLPLK